MFGPIVWVQAFASFRKKKRWLDFGSVSALWGTDKSFLFFPKNAIGSPGHV